MRRQFRIDFIRYFEAVKTYNNYFKFRVVRFIVQIRVKMAQFIQRKLTLQQQNIVFSFQMHSIIEYIVLADIFHDTQIIILHNVKKYVSAS